MIYVALTTLTFNVTYMLLESDCIIFTLMYSLYIIKYYMSILSDTLHHSDNFLIVNPLSTPAHIVPEWYFLPFYSVLRCVSSKALDISLLGFHIAVGILLY